MSDSPMFDNPLFLPPGSVRAIISFALVAGTMYIYITGGEVPDGLLSLTSAVVAFYAGTKAKVAAQDG